MQLTTKVDVDSGIVTASVRCTDVSEETLEALNDFPKYVRYDDIDFSSKVAVIDEVTPELTDPDNSEADLVTLNLVNKNIKLDENFAAEIRLDSTKMSKKELTTSINSFEILSKAKALIFVEKIKERVITLKEEALKQNAADIEGEIVETI